MSRAYNQLKKALIKAGLPARATKTVQGCKLIIDNPIEMLVNMRIDAAPYAGLLLDYAIKLTDPKEVTFVARSMCQPRGFQEAVPWLLSLFKHFPRNGLNQSHLWAIGFAIYTINDKSHYAAVTSICRTKRFGSGRQMLMGTLARARTDIAFDVLVHCVEDSTVRGHAIEALGRFGRTDAIAILEMVEVKKGLYEHKAKQTALRRLNRALVRNERRGPNHDRTRARE